MNCSPLHNPVLLIHGLHDTTRIFQTLSTYLARRGWSTYSFNLKPNNGDAPLEQLAQQVVDYVDKTFSPKERLDLVGLSMGGLVSRYYIQQLGGIERAQRFVTLGTPHHGTWVAYLSRRSGCMQMRPQSDFLQQLNQDVELLEKLKFTSIWTPFDLMIVPATSSQMPIGREARVWVLGHNWVVTSALGLKAIAQALA
ncbi:Lipase family protein, sll1969 homolog [uncultured Leptolyngbya sp.]|uniref:Lipase family protein, sll1969 homolog n=1 Tax=uncultured Leptolyngbya sp. TaxID=332963 RepID=A0A6J4L8U6_9CYAN|nr:Lipase family protein, sll1969 homolog [uncultured Leptolyngbya sp.]